MSFNDPKIREQVISDLEKSISSKTEKSTTATTIENPSVAQRIQKWKQNSLFFKLTGSLSNWFLIVVLLILVSWVRYTTDPLSHLIGYQLIVSDVVVIDGDTFRAKVFPENFEANFRLRSIDAPEMDQPFGFEASEILSQILMARQGKKKNDDFDDNARKSREVIVSVFGLDDGVEMRRNSKNKKISLPNNKNGGGGTVYLCDAFVRDGVFLNQTSVQRLMVERGAAWALKGFHSNTRPSALVVAMEEAKAAKVGLWKDEKIIPPWEFSQKREATIIKKKNKMK